MNKKLAAAYMKEMATGCRWCVLRKIRYTKSDGTVIELVPGAWYTGVPYTQGKKKRRYHLERFRQCLLFRKLFWRKELLGNDCSSAASYAWQKVNPGLPVLSTKKMLKDLCGAQKYFMPVGSYRIAADAAGTDVIIRCNEKDDIADAYRAMTIGDGLLQFDSVTKKGHIMILSKEPLREALFIIDQKGFGPGSSERDDTSWRIDFPFTFNQLMDEGYVPVTLISGEAKPSTMI